MKKSLILFLTILLVTQASAFEFCQDGEAGKSDLRIISVNDMLKDNSKEWIWESLNKIEIEVRVENKEDSQGTYILEATFRDGDNKIKIAKNSEDLEQEFTLSSNERESISLEFEVEEDVDVNNYDLYIKFYKKDNEKTRCVENSEETIKIEKIELCEDGKVDAEDLEIQYIKDETKNNDIAWTWTPGDDIKITLSLENREYSKRTFTTELIALDENNNEISIAENPENLKEKKELNEDETENFEFEFKLKTSVPEGEYTFYAKAYDEENNNICTSLKAYDKSNYKIIEIKKAERNVIIKDIKGPAIAETFSQVEYEAIIINLGGEKEEKVLAIAYNYQLGLLEKIEITNLESGEERKINFSFTIPENASLSQHMILFSTEFEYNEKQDYYKSSSDEDDDIKKYLTISQGTNKETITPIEVETIIENETVQEILEKTKIQTTAITGNAISSSEKKTILPIIIITIFFVIIITIFFVYKKTKKYNNIQPNIARRYTARLN